jgi:hypothetical protein
LTEDRNTRALGGAVVLLTVTATAAPALADPYDYRDRRDTVTSSAGNANASNMAIQTIDPWPPYARNARLPLDGRRAAIAITRYQQNKSLEPKGLENAPIDIQAGAGGTSLTK